MKKSVLIKYAELLVKRGVNLQKGQTLVVYAAVDQEPLVTEVVKWGYKVGAKEVVVEWSSDTIYKIGLKHKSLKTMSEIQDWQIAKLKYRAETLPAMLYIESSDPDGMKGVNQEKIAKARMATYPKIKPIRDEMENKYQWCIAGAASPAWAKKIFPNLPKKQAVQALWDAILETSRMCDDPIEAWNKHNANLKARCEYLNSLGLKSLHYTSKNGTDFTVGLMKESVFLGGSEKTLGSNISFDPNIPTEECFTTPKRGEAEGIVYSTKPLSYQGELIENFSVRFEKGKAVEVHAEKGEDLLKQMISMDESASYLGECALIPFDSPINNTNILFFNTLYDENASCHLALGMGFNNCVRDYEKYSLEEIRKLGVNDSMIHVDFMIGSKDLSIEGTTFDGKKVQIFKEGNWAF